MADVFNKEKRSQIMASISGKDTSVELQIRKALHRRGYRYGLHNRTLPGTPDIVFRRFNAVVFVNGCFWHGHDCPLFRPPSSNRDYWEKKIQGNRDRDVKSVALLQEKGWRTMVVWECSLKGKTKLNFETVILTIEDWLQGNGKHAEIRGVASLENQ